MSEVRKLGKVLVAIIDHRGKTPRKLGGDFALSGVPVLSAKNVKDGRIVGNEGFRFVDHTMWDRWMPVKLTVGDVLLTSEAPLGEVAYVNEAVVQSCLGQRLFGLRADPAALDARFLYYWLRTSRAQAALAARASGTTAQGIRQSELVEVEIELPSLNDQAAVADVLTQLDRRIDLNRALVRSLSGTMTAVFRSWFVEFDPTAANALGVRQPGVPSGLASAFPSSFETVDSLRVPLGWQVSNIGAEVTVVGGSTPSTREPDHWDGPHCWITPRDLSTTDDPVVIGTGRRITNAGLSKISSGLLPEGTVLLSSRAPIGYTAIAAVPLAVNQGFIAMKCDGRLPNVFVYPWLSSSMDQILSRAGGTTFAEVSKANFRTLPVLVPPPAVLDGYKHLTEPMLRRIIVAVRQNATLASLRNTLLPALVGGQLRVDGARDAMREMMV
jgi:type I restriction enzyme, S subunit